MSVPLAELKQRANTPLDPNTANVDAWTKKAESLLSGAQSANKEGDLENAYVKYIQGLRIVIEVIPKAPGFSKLKKEDLSYINYKAVERIAKAALDNAESIALTLDARDNRAKMPEPQPVVSPPVDIRRPVTATSPTKPFASPQIKLFADQRPKSPVYIAANQNVGSFITTNGNAGVPLSMPQPMPQPMPQLMPQPMQLSEQQMANAMAGLVPKATILATELDGFLSSDKVRVLIVDIRIRSAFARGHIRAKDVVCIEPMILIDGISSLDLEENRLILSPPEERHNFKMRHTFDLLVYYDQDSATPPDVTRTSISTKGEFPNALRNFLLAIGTEKNLRRPPALLVGGFEAWYRLKGDTGVASDGSNENDRPGLVRTSSQDRTKRNGMVLHNELVQSLANGSVGNPLQRHGAIGRGRSGYNKSYMDFFQGNRSPLMQSMIGLNTRVPIAGAFPTSLTPAYGMPFPQPQQFQQFQQYQQPQQLQQLQQPQQPLSSAISITATNSSTGATVFSTSPVSSSTSGTGQMTSVPARPSNDVTLRRRQTMTKMFDHPFYGFTEVVDPELAISRPTRPLSKPPTSFQMPVSSWITQTGLSNLGNTCYQNAVIQAFRCTRPFTMYFIERLYKKDKRKVREKRQWNAFGSDKDLDDAFADLLIQMRRGGEAFHRPKEFREAISREARASGMDEYATNDQQDAHLFLTWFLSRLEAYLKRDPDPTELAKIDALEKRRSSLSEDEISSLEWRKYYQNNRSIFVGILGFIMKSRVECVGCHSSSITYEAYLNISVPIPVPSGPNRMQVVTLDQCMRAFTDEEILQGSDAWNCNKCPAERRLSKKIYAFSSMPNILVIQLKKYYYRKTFEAGRLNVMVDFPLEGFDLSPYVIPGYLKGTGSTRYNLYAVINHEGRTVTEGHYTANIYDRGRAVWYKFDDTSVRQLSVQDVKRMGDLAYILFYVRDQIEMTEDGQF